MSTIHRWCQKVLFISVKDFGICNSKSFIRPRFFYHPLLKQLYQLCCTWRMHCVLYSDTRTVCVCIFIVYCTAYKLKINQRYRLKIVGFWVQKLCSQGFNLLWTMLSVQCTMKQTRPPCCSEYKHWQILSLYSGTVLVLLEIEKNLFK